MKSDFILLDLPLGRVAVDRLHIETEALLVVNPIKAAILDALNMKTVLEKKRSENVGIVLIIKQITCFHLLCAYQPHPELTG